MQTSISGTSKLSFAQNTEIDSCRVLVGAKVKVAFGSKSHLFKKLKEQGRVADT
jgi:hypothetical protein